MWGVIVGPIARKLMWVLLYSKKIDAGVIVYQETWCGVLLYSKKIDAGCYCRAYSKKIDVGVIV